jgi:hypothetical protein
LVTAVLFIASYCSSSITFAGDRFQDQRSIDIFEIKSEFSLNNYGDLLAELRILRQQLTQDLGIKIGEEKVEVLLFSNRWNYRAYVGARVPEGINRRALFVKANGLSRIYAFNNMNLERDLRHESTHAMLHNALPFVPLWLDEGLAVYYEEVARKRLNNHHNKEQVKLNLRVGWQPSMTKLEQKNDMPQMDAGDYRQAWMWVHFLLNSSDTSKQILTTYLDEIESGTVKGSLSDRISKAYPNMNDAVKQHMLNGKGK